MMSDGIYRQVGHGTIGRENSNFARFASRSNRLSRLARPRTSNSNMIFFEQPPSPSPLKGLHLSLVFSPLRGKKTAPPVALTLR